MKIIECNSVFGHWPMARRDVSLDKLLEVLDTLGIALAVTTSLKGVFYDHEAGNAETLFVCGKHPRLIPAATINPRHYHTRENVPGKLVQSGFRLLRLFPQVQNWSVHNIVLERILTECTQVKLRVAFPIGKLPDIASYLARIAPRG
ncbi:MAG: hypothetical protein N2255_06520, partial [Kiritimatiellae bacterium]|nr:hypothetical protein [Kiritimatiellia bacterium]